MALKLKKFQHDTLNALKKYLDLARIEGVDVAFAKCSPSVDGQIPQYRKVKGLETIPYICLRLPTGGGKTILAGYSIATAATSYLEVNFPLSLWLVPSNTIRIQTFDAFKNT